MSRIVLGTAQFGMDYGVSNRFGKPEGEEVCKILSCAQSSGITMLDTAPVYGDSERMLSNELPNYNKFKVVTKVSAARFKRIAQSEIACLQAEVERSIRYFDGSNLHAILFHSLGDFFKPGFDYFARWLKDTAETVGFKIGVSLYYPEEIDKLEGLGWDFGSDIELVQLPLNIYDQRFINSGSLLHLKSASVEVHARSVFLQGLLLMSWDQLPEYFQSIRNTHKNLFSYFHHLNVSPLNACLNFVLSQKSVDCIVCGVNRLTELEEILSAAAKPSEAFSFTHFPQVDGGIINPSRWRLKA